MNFSNGTLCEAEFRSDNLYSAVFSIVQVLVNSFVSVAVLRNRVKLRSNSVYLYVLSLLAVNIALGILSAYGNINQATGFERVWEPNATFRIDTSDSRHRAITTWRGFRAALHICLYLVMSANISTLMYGLSKSAYIVGPSLHSPGGSKKQRSSSLWPADKRSKAIVLISLTWLIPLVVALIVATSWNCLDKCLCFDAYYPNSYSCQADIYQDCSKIFQTMRNSFLLMVVIVWFLLAVVIVAMLLTAIRKYRTARNLGSTKSRRSVAVADSHHVIEITDSRPGHQNADDFGENGGPDTATTTTAEETKQTESPTNGNEDDEFQDECFWNSLNFTFKAMLLLSTLFILCTTPSMIMILVGYSNPHLTISLHHLIVPFLATFVYSIASPLILVHYMPGLRNAVSSLFYSCRCCTRTIVQRGSVRDVSKSH